ncbi:uncharacterized protein VTP21DRAFT_10589 [Calcarisporiella thermophila]|uniref:uncharacterized protein n=1 Tax=Calcarisporiella thermophila TaxID=911321 RepID=UPI00374279BC
MPSIQDEVQLVPLCIDEELVKCSQHKREVCSECNADYTAQNSLYRALKQTNGQVPPPNSVHPVLGTQITKLKDEGNQKYRAGQHEEAVRLYTLAIDMSYARPLWEPHMFVREELSVLLGNRAAAYLAMGDFVKAYVDAEIAIRAKPPYSKAHFRKGKALLGLKRYQEAIQAFEIGLQVDPKSDELQKGLKEAKELLGSKDE